MTSHAVSEKLRFKFGKNWQSYVHSLNDQRIKIAEQTVLQLLRMDSLKGKTLLDIGSGSGLFSLCARRLGARVYSFDFDQNSVACTQALKEKYYPQDKNWTVEQGSILDDDYVSKLPQFDIVYSWGVLHHTGNMEKAFEKAADLTKDGGSLAISIYNDQGMRSRMWFHTKKIYNTLPAFLRPLVMVPCFFILRTGPFLRGLIKLDPFQYWREYYQQRGMSLHHDLIDWVGGYPFEVASPGKIFDFFHKRQFYLHGLKTVGGKLGCNEFLFIRKSPE